MLLLLLEVHIIDFQMSALLAMYVKDGVLWVSDSKHSPVVKVPEGFIGDGLGDGGVELLGICINI